MNKKFLKPVIKYFIPGVVFSGSLMLAGDKLDVIDKLSGAYNKIVDVCTVDTVEAAQKFMDKAMNEEHSKVYYESIFETANFSCQALPDSLAVIVLTNRLDSMSNDYQLDVVHHGMRNIVDNKKESLSKIIVDAYKSVK